MRNILLGSTILLALAPAVLAQRVPPFFGGGVTAYDPQVAVVPSGALIDAQATVSADRRYVTLNMNATNSNVRALVRFPVVSTQSLGFVGGAALDPMPVATPRGATPNKRNAAPTPATPSPDQIDRNAKAWILTRQGIFLLKSTD